MKIVMLILLHLNLSKIVQSTKTSSSKDQALQDQSQLPTGTTVIAQDQQQKEQPLQDPEQTQSKL